MVPLVPKLVDLADLVVVQVVLEAVITQVALEVLHRAITVELTLGKAALGQQVEAAAPVA
jgi:hypothetical protein